MCLPKNLVFLSKQPILLADWNASGLPQDPLNFDNLGVVIIVAGCNSAGVAYCG